MIKLFFLSIFLFSCNQSTIKSQVIVFYNKKGDKITVKKILKSKEEWKKELDPFVYYVSREKGTERAFTGELNNNKQTGDYFCSSCGTKLFESKHKYDSGSGWPSFYQVHQKELITEIVDKSHFMTRTEVTCAVCDAHLGHLFDDGPQPSGLRYCINSASLIFKKSE
jgi:peptide-methionine (R)-S-oxide reductase